MELATTIAIVGATATGKSDVALALAEEFGADIINTDSMQLYRGMDIGTAKTPYAERRGIIHHQLDVLEVHEEASVAAYQRHARNDVKQVHAAGKPAIAVGGSGLYVRALLDRLQFPPTDESVRAALEQRVEQEGSGILYAELRAKDPQAAEVIDPRNTRRLVRALEVIELTGQPFSATMPRHEYEIPARQLGIMIDRTQLRERILARAHQMFASGLIEETQALIEQGLREGKTAAKATGYAQAIAVVDGKMSLEEAIESTATATHQLARRQETWFRRDPRVVWIDGGPGVTERARAALG